MNFHIILTTKPINFQKTFFKKGDHAKCIK